MSEFSHFQSSGISVTTRSVALPQSGTSKEGTHVAPPLDYTPMPWVWWGAGNNFPAEAVKIIRSNDVLSSAISTRTLLHAGAGLLPYLETASEDQKRVKTPFLDEPLRSFRRASRIDSQYLRPIIQDFENFGLCLTECFLSRDGSTITGIRHVKASTFRYKRLEDNELRPTVGMLSYNWIYNGGGDHVEVPLADPFTSPGDYTGKRLKSIFYVAKLPDPLSPYYPLPVWYSAKESGWLDISNEIPVIKKAILSNMTTIKYIVRIPHYHWRSKYPDWDEKPEIQNERREKEQTDFDNLIAGSENAGKTLWTDKWFDEISGNEFKGWEIEAIDDKLKGGEYIPDSQEAASHILFAAGVDPSIVGVAMPGGKMGAGSGSDKRESLLVRQAMLPFDRIITLEALEFVAIYNNWDPNLRFGLIDISTAETIDQNPNGRKDIVN